MFIKAIIFDLGDVLMPVNREKTYTALRALGITNPKELFEAKEFQALYVQFEHNLDTASFRMGFRKHFCLSPSITDQQIDDAWCAMLEDIPAERLNDIQHLKEQGYKIFLLSNSNEIHHANIQHRYSQIFSKLFDTQYYSHLLNLAKPDAAIFDHVITKEKIAAQETLFVDDKISNVEGAKQANIWAIQFTIAQSVKEIMQTVNSINQQLNPQDKQNISLSVFQPPIKSTNDSENTSSLNL